MWPPKRGLLEDRVCWVDKNTADQLGVHITPISPPRGTLVLSEQVCSYKIFTSQTPLQLAGLVDPILANEMELGVSC